MTKVRNFLLCLVLLALAGILHHEWTQMSGSSGIEPEVRAATLSNAVGTTCTGTCTWHFVNNQTQGQCQTLTAYFTCDGNNVTKGPITASSCLNSTDHYYVTTNGTCSLVTASTGNQPGRLVLSSLAPSTTPTPTPTPTPSPSPSPSPTI